MDFSGQLSRRVQVIAPEAMAADDLSNSEIWRLVQGSPLARLQRLDRLLIVAHDEVWAAEALVASANEHGAELAGVRVFDFNGGQPDGE